MTTEVLSFYLLDISSSFCLSAAHNVLFYTLDFHTPILHFLHFFVLFVVLFIVHLRKHTPIRRLNAHIFTVPVILQFIITLLSNRSHSQQRSGGLYLLRIFDFLTTVTVFVYGRSRKGKTHTWPGLGLLFPIAFGSSLSWLEFGILEYDSFGLLLSPILAIIRGIQIIHIQECFRMCAIKQLDLFMLQFAGMCSAVLFPQAFYSWIHSSISNDASWESIDYVLMCVSILFMAFYKYSEIWLQIALDARIYMVLEHTKYWMASIGQNFIQNMAHACAYSFVGKLITLSALIRYAASYFEQNNNKREQKA
ncbi:hypothetical protein AB6A40_005496 [Gnathostoma spinigerum]|uniref:Uncharacterized protein n=1 Tax=Gnathostoma spinigerum TaxID=75299 RepID=A0ABD6EQF1_9BILA